MNQNLKYVKTWQFQTEDSDFIKSMVSIPDSQEKVLLTTEKSQLSLLSYQNDELMISLLQQCSSPIYDSLMIQDKVLALSQFEHPLCLYKLNDDQTSMKSLGRINDIKPNSELFLTPIQMKYRKENLDIIGCGKGFLHSYDINKLKVKNHFKCVKVDQYASCLDITPIEGGGSSHNLVAVGYFDKTVSIFSPQDDRLLTTLKIHIGGITQVCFSPKNQLYLYSAARQDNFIYEWDLRNTTSFVRYFNRSNCTNQRTSFYTDGDNFIFGNDNGTANFCTNDSCSNIQICRTQTNVNSSVMINNGKTYLFAYGEREFKLSESVTVNHESGITAFQYDQKQID